MTSFLYLGIEVKKLIRKLNPLEFFGKKIFLALEPFYAAYEKFTNY